MMKVQEYLCSGKTLEDLNTEFGIENTKQGKLVILNYSMINSSKSNEIANECRGLILDTENWGIASRSFSRFFNLGEMPEINDKFDWTYFNTTSKEDGSLISLFWYQDKWIICTRGSFAQGTVCAGGPTWEELFWKTGIEQEKVHALHNAYSYIFELCSKYNKVVREYSTPTLFLLTAVHKQTGLEMHREICDNVAEKLNVKRPQWYPLLTKNDIEGFVNNHPEATYEGVVIQDCNNLRIKVKNPRYVALHHLKNNGLGFRNKDLLPLILSNEYEELISYFPECKEKVFDIIDKMNQALANMLSVWESAKSMESQKEFAQYVMKHTVLSSILFNARKNKVEPLSLWKDSADIILKRVIGE